MNQHINDTTKNGAIKTLAILGFVVVIVLGVWLAVKVVSLIPSAFSSLASIADSINNNRPTNTLTIESEERVINSEGIFTLAWTNVKREGTYSFSYTCTPGITVNLRIMDAITSDVACGEEVELPQDATTMDISIASESQRFVDVSYSLFFTEEGSDEHLYERNGKITVVNARIPQDGVAVVTPAPVPTPVVIVPTPTPTPVVTPTPAKPTPTPVPTPLPKPITKTVTYIPQSNPNGFTDLQAKVLGVGTVKGSVFVADNSIDNDDRAAIQIEIKNFGTKTSENWDLVVELPNGSEYKLTKELGLKPNERAVLTIGFDASDTKGSKSFSGKVTVKNDTKTENNSFKGSMTLVD